MMLVIETPEEDAVFTKSEIHLAELVELIKVNKLNERFDVLVLVDPDKNGDGE